MTSVNYVTNDKGETTGLLIDLVQLRNSELSDTGFAAFLEDLDDLIAIELNRGQKGRPYDDVRKEINVEDYNREIDDAVANVEKGKFYDHGDVEKMAEE